MGYWKWRVKIEYDYCLSVEELQDNEYLSDTITDNKSGLDISKKSVRITPKDNSKYEIIENGKNKDSFHLHVFKYEDIINKLQNVGFYINKVYGQSYINKIVNKEIEEYKLTNIINDAKTIAYPNEEDIE